ncbi:MAG: PHP domain-containing protein [Lachnospiraceae bacterium]|nr:PHP domain-containing protein [Lachnospiraceae bacterium]
MTIDLHTHTIASGHGTADTITDLAREAAACQMSLLGICDHAPAMAGAASVSYFRSLPRCSRKRFGVSLLFGAELNILTEAGDVDLEDSVLEQLDYAVISLHSPLFRRQSAAGNTNAFIHAMRHPNVTIIGHPDDDRFPVIPDDLITAARKFHVLVELNNSSLSPDGYRGDAAKTDRLLLQCCRDHQVPILIGSDSHGCSHIGDDRYARELIFQTGFPPELIANDNPKLLASYIRSEILL